MKRQKRNRSDIAISRGYQAGFSGQSRDKCPFDTGEPRHHWLSGWREGREDRWNGYNVAASVQKMSAMQHASH